MLPLSQSTNETESPSLFWRVIRDQFMIIEDYIKSSDKLHYIFRSIIKSVKNHRSWYISGKGSPSQQKHVIELFKNDVYDAVNNISTFSIIKNIKFEELFLSLVCLSKVIENTLYNESVTILDNSEYRARAIPATAAILRLLPEKLM